MSGIMFSSTTPSAVGNVLWKSDTNGNISASIQPATATVLGGVKAGSGVTIAGDGTLSVSGGGYTLPPATSSTLGGVKTGSGVTILSDGTLSYTLPVATASVLGGVKQGAGVTIAGDGTLTSSAGVTSDWLAWSPTVTCVEGGGTVTLGQIFHSKYQTSKESCTINWVGKLTINTTAPTHLQWTLPVSAASWLGSFALGLVNTGIGTNPLVDGHAYGTALTVTPPGGSAWPVGTQITIMITCIYPTD
jgi:hypothetical protein